jgi:transposase
MSRAYSYDFRQKVIAAIELNGLKKQEASQLFNISRNTINLWFQQKAGLRPRRIRDLARNLPHSRTATWEQGCAR